MVKNAELESKIKDVLNDLRPYLNMEGGDVEFIKYDSSDGTVYVNMTGACAMCMFQDDTLESSLLWAIQDKLPEVKRIVNSPI